MNRVRPMKPNFQACALAFTLMIYAAPLTMSGCANSKTVRTEEETRTVSSAGDSTTTRETRETEVSDDRSSGGCSGVLSCTLDVVGNIIALPFRLVGGLIDFLF